MEPTQRWMVTLAGGYVRARGASSWVAVTAARALADGQHVWIHDPNDHLAGFRLIDGEVVPDPDNTDLALVHVWQRRLTDTLRSIAA